MTTSLIEPCTDYEGSYVEYIRELGDAERYPFPLDFDHADFPALVERLLGYASGQNLLPGHVANSTFWLVDDAEILGVSNLRHTLNDTLKTAGGHIGLGIRPSVQGNGLGKRLLSLTVTEAWQRGIDPIHVHCMKDNLASARMILANGGHLRSEAEYGDTGDIIQRYTITSA
ncbi:MAG: GNAT family N-acetyltransferase [Pseudomonadota bacterium]